MNELLDTFKSFATPVAALFAAFSAYKFGSVQAAIGRRQAETARLAAEIAKNKLKLDLFDRRLVVYDAVTTMLARVATMGGLTNEDERAYLVGLTGAQWLFDEPVVKFLEKTIWHQMVDYGALHSALQDEDERDERVKLAEMKAVARRALMDQRHALDLMMAPYLKLES